ncbi:DUF4241 domain-containing protein [Streptomyces sp. NPDC003691]
MVWTGHPRLTAGPRTTAYLHSVFVPGTRLGGVYDQPEVDVTVVDLIHAATIRIPSGRLGVGNPWSNDWVTVGPWEDWPDADWRELAERIPPGAYRVETAWTSAVIEFNGEPLDMRDCSGSRLIVRDEPVVGWEMALGTGERVEDIPHGLEPGFWTDTGMGCFADAEHWRTLTRPFRKHLADAIARPGETVGRDTVTLPDGNELVRDDTVGADLVTVAAEETTLPTWLGRTAAGEVACLVVAPPVMMLRDDAMPEPTD